MDDSSCLRFFVNPAQSLHRRYEVLRMFFVEHRSPKDIAQQFGYAYESVRAMVRDFRAQCRAAQPPPFSWSSQ